MQLLFGHDAAVVRWAAERLGGDYDYPGATGIGVIDDNGVLRGAIILERCNKHTAEVTFYSEGASTLSVARHFFFHVFYRLGVSRLQIHTQRNNKAIKKAAPKWGFQWDGVSKNFYGPGSDGLRFFMTPQNCKWIYRYGQIRTEATTSRATRGRQSNRRPTASEDRHELAETGRV